MDLYPWIVLIHVLAAFGFAMAHGVSVFAAFAMRSSRQPEAVRTLLGLSSMSIGALYGFLLLLLIAGITAAIMGGWFGRGWPWAAIAVVVVIVVAMYAMASRYYATIRSAVGLPSMNDKKGEPPSAPVSDEELAKLLDTRRPEALAAIGFIGFVVLVWLMELKPF
jgi:MFS family permease